MDSFKPSGDFVARTMQKISFYETGIIRDKERANAVPFSMPAVFALSAGGVLLGILNLVRMAWTLIAPAACL
jgi:hypothetical protein